MKPQPWLQGSAMPTSGSLGDAGTISVWHRAALAAPHRDHPAAPAANTQHMSGLPSLVCTYKYGKF